MGCIVLIPLVWHGIVCAFANKENFPTQHNWAHVGLPHRAMASATIIQLAASWRLKDTGTSYDGTSVFGCSVNCQFRCGFCFPSTQPRRVHFKDHHHHQSTMTVHLDNGPLDLHTTSGSLQGHTIPPGICPRLCRVCTVIACRTEHKP